MSGNYNNTGHLDFHLHELREQKYEVLRAGGRGEVRPARRWQARCVLALQ